MGLDQLDVLPKGWLEPNVDRAFAAIDQPAVNPRGRDQFSRIKLQVGGRKPKHPATDPLPFDHFPGQAIWVIQQRIGRLKITAAKQFPDQPGFDDPAANFDWRDNMNLKTMFFSQLFQGGRAPAPSFPQSVIVTNKNRPNPKFFDQIALNILPIA